ncbi:MAG TPA: DUF6519 domain-containing protein, partial [Bryobacteraceae bacterium]|nr:DUF6519 domain-containing protein [Bryobacteraceae bacterium]
MRGDFSRLRFERNKHYTSVLEQQGRVALDADNNEQRAIDEDIRQTENIDIIGPFGGPKDDGGFAITVDGNTIKIGAGRYYVHGLLCENETGLTYGAQPYLINPAIADSDLLTDLSRGAIDSIRLFLEVWRRMVTALDDPCLREPALGQADTTTRLQTVWRVVAERTLVVNPPSFPKLPFATVTALRGARLERAAIAKRATFAGAAAVGGAAAPVVTNTGFAGGVGQPAPQVDCCAEMYLPPFVSAPGKLSAQTTGGSSDCSCQPTPAAGYRGLENQLYRVEIHRSGTEAAATLKWSRENGSVVVAVTGVAGADVVVDSLGLDANLGFQAGQWVELSDDTYLFGPHPNQPGELVQIKSVSAEHLTITMTAPVANINPARNARLRRWEQSGASATSTGVPLSVGSWMDLENGVQIRFAAGQFQSGDYWLIPARTATGQIAWPPCGSDGDAFQPPMSMEVQRAPLACIHWDSHTEKAIVEDCRRLFPPLTDVAGGALSALHVTATNWSNDDVLAFDHLLATGLTVVLDQAATGRIDSSIFSLTLEVPVVSQVEGIAVIEGLAPIVLRTSMPLDGQITQNTVNITWNLPFRDSNGRIPGIQVEALALLDIMLLQGIAYASFARVRVRLEGRSVFSGDGSSRIFLDGQSFGTPGVRADGVTPRTALTFPSGAAAKGSDFESWFFLAPE